MKSKIKFPKDAGIYKVTCLINNKIYIGKSININQRIGSYKSYEKKNKQRGRLVNAIRKYGWDNFKVEVLEIMEKFNVLEDNQKLLELESNYIKQFNTTDPNVGYNMCEYSTDFAGKKHTKQSRENMSKGKMGSKHSEETKLKMRESKIGKKVSDETKKNMSIAQRKNNLKEETKLNRINCRLGKLHTVESLDKMKKAKSVEVLGVEEYERRKAMRKRENLSPETLEKMRKAQSGKTLSLEHREKLRNAKLGKKQSEETKMKSRLTRAKNKELKNKTSIDILDVLV